MHYLNKYQSIDEFLSATYDYFKYYNNERISAKLDGMTPMQFRRQKLIAKEHLEIWKKYNIWGSEHIVGLKRTKKFSSHEFFSLEEQRYKYTQNVY